VGWYSTGPRLREADVDINQLMASYCETPVLVICEVEVGGGSAERLAGAGTPRFPAVCWLERLEPHRLEGGLGV
jgi:hypothetical protein